MLVTEEAVEILELRRQCKSIREIARMLGLLPQQVRRYLRSKGLLRYEPGREQASSIRLSSTSMSE
jgi:transposase